jgi:probable sporulation protein (polysaccharide deacetylase family)
MKGAVKLKLRYHIVVILAIVGILWVLIQNSYINLYLVQMKEKTVLSSKQTDLLYIEIENQAKNYEKSPQNAKIDSIWKTVPGYNGLEVDIQKSYLLMKEKGTFDESKLIYNQVSPKIHMTDLEPGPLYRAHPEKPVVSLLINVAWGNEYVQDMLTVLKKHQVKATFFLEGRWTKNNPELAKMIAQGGHEIGNHSYSHPNMKTLSTEKTKEEIIETNKVIEAVTEKKVKWFAPPSGYFRDETVAIAASLGMGTVMWSVDTIDWQKPSSEVLINRVMSKIHPGAFVLMHPTEVTASSLESLIKQIKQKNLHIVTVTEAVDEKRIVH